MKIVGTIQNIIFRNEINGYTVLLVESGKAVFTLLGNIASVNIGETIEADTVEIYNEQYGTQYKINSYVIVLPDENLDAIEKFIFSLKIKGIGEQTAKRIVENFGEDTINTIMNYPERLYGIKGLDENKINNLHDAIIERQNEIDIVFFLLKYNLTPLQIRSIIDEYGDETLKVVNDNPYQMALNVDGIGFVICDSIAKANGYDAESNKRICAGLLYILESEYANGNVYIEKKRLVDMTIELLSLRGDTNFDDILYDLEINLKIVCEMVFDIEMVFLKSAYNIEKELSHILFERKDDIMIITGGPGTGKTYNINKYLEEAEDNGKIVALCAPTGRAAKRITEVTGHNAKTIHRLLECIGDEDGNNRKIYFQKNEDNPIDCDVLIVDEMSMVDEYIMLKLIKAVPNGVKVILVGDVDQLPSVGAGQVLKDMIESGYFNVNKLIDIHRQEDGSNIVLNAHNVNDGKKVIFDDSYEDFKFIHKPSEERINEDLCRLVKDVIPNHFHIGNDQIQVICPSKKGTCGTESINILLQSVLNPKSNCKDEIVIGERIIRQGDKVMQTSNNYEIPYDVLNEKEVVRERGMGVFNGDIGYVTNIDSDTRNLVVKFDDREAYYGPKDIKDLCLAYAITVHKAQGSEYDVVIMPMANAPTRLRTKKILYTAMTRAKKCLLFIGAEKYFYEMARNSNYVLRNSALCSKLYLYDAL